MGLEKGIENAERRVMSEDETLEFLRENGVVPLETFEPGKPVLYVFPQEFREDRGLLSRRDGDVPPDKRPSIARLDAPTLLDLNAPSGRPYGKVYPLVNHGGRIDYFTINSKTKKPVLVRSTSDKNQMYVVRRETLFMPNDELFPRGTDEHDA